MAGPFGHLSVGQDMKGLQGLPLAPGESVIEVRASSARRVVAACV